MPLYMIFDCEPSIQCGASPITFHLIFQCSLTSFLPYLIQRSIKMYKMLLQGYDKVLLSFSVDNSMLQKFESKDSSCEVRCISSWHGSPRVRTVCRVLDKIIVTPNLYQARSWNFVWLDGEFDLHNLQDLFFRRFFVGRERNNSRIHSRLWGGRSRSWQTERASILVIK